MLNGWLSDILNENQDAYNRQDVCCALLLLMPCCAPLMFTVMTSDCGRTLAEMKVSAINHRLPQIRVDHVSSQARLDSHRHGCGHA